jgi:pimeloyl-ACP methyl ester carboxylesterase
MSEYPRDEWVQVNGLQLHYRDWGGSGQQIILLHGLASTSHIWDIVGPMLAQHFAVVALDQRGHGESDKPDDGYDFASVISDLHGFIQHVGANRSIIVGHSWGGDVALEYGVKFPEVARGLCFVDGGMIEISTRPGNTLEKARVDMAPPEWTGITLKKLLERARTWRPPEMLTPKHQEILLTNFHELPDGTITARLSRQNHLRIIEALWDHLPSALYPQVRCPVLLMPARQKNDTSPNARRWNREKGIATASKLLPVSKTVWLEDSIHDVLIQRPELVAGVIRDHLQNGFFGMGD